MTDRPALSPVAPSAAIGAWPGWLASIARTLNLVLYGKINATATVTLTPSVTTTTLYDSRIGYFSHVALEAQTASAAAARAAGLYVVPGQRSAVITHPSDAAVDQLFSVLVIG